MKFFFIIVALFHDKINEVKALWGTVNHLKVEINVMSKKLEKIRGHNKHFGATSKTDKYFFMLNTQMRL